ncbi:MAG TPA: cytochrome P450 [Amycolatopsis sp.]
MTDAATTARGRGGASFVDGVTARHLVGRPIEAYSNGVTVAHQHGGTTTWLVSGYQLAREFLRDNRFSRAEASQAGPFRGPALRMSITEMDRPLHTRIRTLIGGAFAARHVEQLRPRIERLAETVLRQAVARGPGGDLVADVCAPLTFAAHCEVLGVPPARREAIRRTSLARLGQPGAACPEQTYRAELALHEEVTDLLADPALPAGLLADLVRAHREDGLLSPAELTGLASSLFFDGHALAAAQIATTVLCLLRRPGLFAAVRENTALLGPVIEEALRYSPSVTLSMTRIAGVDLTFGGAAIRAGDEVVAAIPIANRDEAVFDRADVFLPDRGRTRHLAFGHGTHHCIGAHLARLEINAALRALVQHTPRMRLAVPEEELDWFAAPNMRSLVAVPVRWHEPEPPPGS